MIKRPPINNQIKASEIRIIDEEGNQMGVLPTSEGLRLAQEKGLDLIQVTEKIDPPVCKIMDFGKYLYREQRKERKALKQRDELKSIRLSFKISPHDMEIRAQAAEKFIKKGHKVKIELVLRGREKALADFAKEKLSEFIKILQEKLPIKTERELKREARGFTLIIAKG